jgi:hypothetical protein
MVADGSGNPYIGRSFLTIGKRYRITFRAKSSNSTTVPIISGGLGTATAIINPALTAAYQQYIFEGTTLSAGLTICPWGYITPANLSDCTLDDITVTQIGVTADLTSSGIMLGKWLDSSNRMYADFTACETVNLPMTESINLPYFNVSGAVTVTVPKGYSLDRIFIKNTNGVAMGTALRIGTGPTGIDVVAGVTVGTAYNDMIEDTSVLLKKYFGNDTADYPLYVSAATWGTTILNITLICRRIA